MREDLLKLVRGTAAAAACTLPGMALLALAVVYTPMGDATLTACNQLLKSLSVFVGAYAAVGRGGNRGFLTGAAVGLLYMTAGYAMYCALEGNAGAFALFGGEALFGALIGALSGAVCANLPAAKPKRKTA